MTNIGIIGAGMIANVHAETAKRIGTNVVAVHDPQTERSNIFATKHDCVLEDSVDALLARGDLDGVVVAVPNDQHATIAIASLEAGKHVLLEKPMAMSLQQCDDILEARDASGKVLQMGFVCRYSPSAIVAKQLIEDGELGEIHHVQATLLRQRGIPGLGGWFTTKERSGGGCLIDIGVHLIDVAMHITSKKTPTRVLGKCTKQFTEQTYAYDDMWSTPIENGTFDVEDRVRALLTDASGTSFQFDVAWATHLPEKTIKDGLFLEGTKGALVLDLWENEITLGYAKNGAPKMNTIPITLEDAWNDAFDGEHRSFANAVASGSLDAGAGSGEDGRLVQRVVEAIYESNDANQEVAVK
jgi:predicted dehydrogenase